MEFRIQATCSRACCAPIRVPTFACDTCRSVFHQEGCVPVSWFWRGALVEELLPAEYAVLVRVEALEAFGRCLRIGLSGQKLFARELAVTVYVLPVEERTAIQLGFWAGDLWPGLGIGREQ